MATADTSEAPSEIATDDLRDIAADLTKFQMRCLATIANDPGTHGLGVKDELEDYYPDNVRHGRLYPNLDTLVALDLVDKGQRDRRTNTYTLTERGHAVLAYEIAWLGYHQRSPDEVTE